MVNLKARRRVLIADSDMIFARRLSGYLWDRGFEARVCRFISDVKYNVEFWRPETVIIDMLLPETNALSLLKFIQTKDPSQRPQVIVTFSNNGPPRAMEQLRQAGASDFLTKPFSLEELLRVINPIKPEEELSKPVAAPVAEDPSVLKELHLVNLLLKQASLEQQVEVGLFNLMRMINMKVKGVRTSLIHCLNDTTGLVLASHDDKSVRGLAISLKDYPEVCDVRRTGEPSIIPNVKTSEILRPVVGKLSSMRFETIALFPVFRQGVFFGVMSVRLERKDPAEMFYIEKFGQVCSQIISLVI